MPKSAATDNLVGQASQTYRAALENYFSLIQAKDYEGPEAIHALIQLQHDLSNLGNNPPNRDKFCFGEDIYPNLSFIDGWRPTTPALWINPAREIEKKGFDPVLQDAKVELSVAKRRLGRLASSPSVSSEQYFKAEERYRKAFKHLAGIQGHLPDFAALKITLDEFRQKRKNLIEVDANRKLGEKIGAELAHLVTLIEKESNLSPARIRELRKAVIKLKIIFLDSSNDPNIPYTAAKHFFLRTCQVLKLNTEASQAITDYIEGNQKLAKVYFQVYSGA